GRWSWGRRSRCATLRLASLGDTTRQGRVFCIPEPTVGSSATSQTSSRPGEVTRSIPPGQTGRSPDPAGARQKLPSRRGRRLPSSPGAGYVRSGAAGRPLAGTAIRPGPIAPGGVPAAEQDFAKAQFNLGLKYANGQGVEQDYVQAHMWMDLAAPRAN